MTPVADKSISIFREYYEDKPFVDRFEMNPRGAIDVIVPVMHTNELWEENLKSFYREIPINRLLIGDGGCIDNSIEIARKFPRVEIHDHRDFKSLGYSIKKLIEASTAEWFVYVHSDAYLPPGWFDAMAKYQGTYDWYGCPMRHTVMVEYDLDYGERPWAGSQMGRKAAFTPNLHLIDDDYVYRQEDFVWSEVMEKGGFKEGKVPDTFHYHQTMLKHSPWSRSVKSVSFDVDVAPEERTRTWVFQAKGIVKYLRPEGQWAIDDAVESFAQLIDEGTMTRAEYKQWVLETNPAWLPVIEKGLRKRRFKNTLRSIARKVGKAIVR